MQPPTSVVAAAGLTGGYAAARHAGRSDLATVVFTAAGVWCARSWLRSSGRGVAGLLLGVYLVAFWVSHPLARRIGAWPAVLAMSGAAAGVTAALADHPVPAPPVLARPSPARPFPARPFRAQPSP
jgi:hypothetical protein